MIFIHRGDAPLSIRQATQRGTQIVARELSAAGARAGDETIFGATLHENLPARLIAVLAQLPGNPSTYSEYAAQWEIENQANSANNLFNHQLAAYKKASARLSAHRLADGQAEVVEQQETGQFNDQGEPITTPVVVKRSIEPLPAQIEQAVYDYDGNALEPVMVDNPAIVKDDQERAIAAGTIAQIPQAVIDFHAELAAG